MSRSAGGERRHSTASERRRRGSARRTTTAHLPDAAVAQAGGQKRNSTLSTGKQRFRKVRDALKFQGTDNAVGDRILGDDDEIAARRDRFANNHHKSLLGDFGHEEIKSEAARIHYEHELEKSRVEQAHAENRRKQQAHLKARLAKARAERTQALRARHTTKLKMSHGALARSEKLTRWWTKAFRADVAITIDGGSKRRRPLTPGWRRSGAGRQGSTRWSWPPQTASCSRRTPRRRNSLRWRSSLTRVPGRMWSASP